MQKRARGSNWCNEKPCNCDVSRQNYIINKKVLHSDCRPEVCSSQTLVISMGKKFVLVLFSLFFVIELTASLPHSHFHNTQHEQVGPLSRGFEDETMQKKDTPLALTKLKRSSEEHAHRKKAHVPGPSHLRLASRDQSKKGPHSRSGFHRWFAANHRSPKFVAISIFVGCLVFMAVAFAITCCWYQWKQTKRVKKATHVDVESRQELIPDKVSKIHNAHIDVEGY